MHCLKDRTVPLIAERRLHALLRAAVLQRGLLQVVHRRLVLGARPEDLQADAVGWYSPGVGVPGTLAMEWCTWLTYFQFSSGLQADAALVELAVRRSDRHGYLLAQM